MPLAEMCQYIRAGLIVDAIAKGMDERATDKEVDLACQVKRMVHSKCGQQFMFYACYQQANEEFHTAYEYAPSANEKKELMYKINTAEQLVGLESKVTPYLSEYFAVKKAQYVIENECMVTSFDVDMIQDYQRFEAVVLKKAAMGLS